MRRLTFDRDKCLACRSCEIACAVAHSATGVLVSAIAEASVPRRRVSMAIGPQGLAALRCAQCDEPLCVFSCKSGALHRVVDGGGVEFDESRCVGCLMCYMVCPVGIRPAFAAANGEAATAWQPSRDHGEAKADHTVVRCDVCASRETPACVEACPTKAMGVAAGAVGPARPSRGDALFAGHVVVVGSSAAGIAACEAAREAAPGCRITMITADAERYSRPLLPYVLAGRVDRDRLPWRASDYLAKLGVEVIDRARAVGVSVAGKTVVIERGASTEKIAFDRLVIATGARATRLDVSGSDLAGVCGLRDIEDLEGIEKTLEECRPKVPPSPQSGFGEAGGRAVVVGGGNVGLQAAEALAQRGVKVTVVVKSPHLLSQMVDAEAGRRVGELFARHGVSVRTGRDVVEITASSGRAHRVRLDDGEWIDADLVIVGKGIQPNVEWLESSGITVGRGVVVDEHGRTNVPGILAAGDCAEMKHAATGQSAVSGIWPIAYETGRVAGLTAVGVDAASPGPLRMNSSRFFDTPVISIGEVRTARVPGATEYVAAADDGVYRKLVVKDGRLIGAVLYGGVTDAGLYYRLYRDGTALDDASADDLERARTAWIAAIAEQIGGAASV